MSSSGVGRRQALQEEVQSSLETIMVHPDTGDLLPNKAERGLGRWLSDAFVIEYKDLCHTPGIHIKCQVWQPTVHTCDSTLGKQREKDPWDLLAASLATTTSSMFYQRSCLRK